MALISLRDVSMGFGGPLLLEEVNLQIEQGERICLLGRNGTGKTTLLKLINGDLQPDNGEIVYQQGTKTGFLDQEVPRRLKGVVLDVVAKGLEPAQAGHGDKLPGSRGDWNRRAKISKIISQMELDPEADVETLSSGFKRRVLLARELAGDPDILLLDEPTNHLDIQSITWLEDFLLRYNKTLLFVTHDRVFLKKLATRIVDLERANLTSWSCNYETYLEKKEAALEVEASQNKEFDKNLAREEVWIRQGVRERRTRNQGRVRKLLDMRQERESRKEREGFVRMQAQEADRSGRLVIKVRGIEFSYGSKVIINNFSTDIMRGDKIGIIGPNGSGKTTLLSILLKGLKTQKGSIRHGTNLEVAYFDQLREKLDEDKSVADNVGDGLRILTVNGNPRNIFSYLQDFLFPPDRSRTLVRALSGGERNRLLLAKIFTKPSNVLVLDEPTNDLDLETLELLEELLLDYSGTVLLVSHDRAFLNSVATSIIAFEENGKIKEYVGGYDDWLRQKKDGEKTGLKTSGKKGSKQKQKTDNRNRLSYKEKLELEGLPKRIEELEAEKEKLFKLMSDPEFYRRSGEEIARVKSDYDLKDSDLEKAYNRWEELEKKTV